MCVWLFLFAWFGAGHQIGATANHSAELYRLDVLQPRRVSDCDYLLLFVAIFGSEISLESPVLIK